VIGRIQMRKTNFSKSSLSACNRGRSIQKGHNRTHALQQIRRGHAARSTRISISLRSIPKSIGLVRSASAPFSKAFRFVSASP